MGYYVSIHEHWRHKNNDHNNKITKAQRIFDANLRFPC